MSISHSSTILEGGKRSRTSPRSEVHVPFKTRILQTYHAFEGRIRSNDRPFDSCRLNGDLAFYKDRSKHEGPLDYRIKYFNRFSLFDSLYDF